MALHRYSFGLHLIWNQVFELFQMDLCWKSQSRKCQPRSDFQNPDCQKKHSIFFSNFDYSQYKQITANLFVSDQIQCIGVRLVFFRFRFCSLKWINGVKMKYENRKFQSKADVLGSLKFIYQIKRFNLLTSRPCEKNWFAKIKPGSDSWRQLYIYDNLLFAASK